MGTHQGEGEGGRERGGGGGRRTLEERKSSFYILLSLICVSFLCFCPLVCHDADGDGDDL